MLQRKTISSPESSSIFDLIKEERITEIKKELTQFNLKTIGPDGHPPIIAALSRFIETKEAQVKSDLKQLIDDLISNGANPFQKDKEGSNALTWAIISKDEELIEKFDSLGLNAFQRNHYGNSAFHYWLADHKKLKLKSIQIEVEHNAYQMLHLFAFTFTKLIDKNKKFSSFIK